MNQIIRLFLAVLSACALARAVDASAGEPAEPETITIAGTEYRIIPDEVFREMGFEFPDVPREENAAYDYIRAINAYHPWEGEAYPRAVDAVRNGWPGDDGELRTYVAANEETLKHLRAGAAKRASHFPFVLLAPHGEVAHLSDVIFTPPHLPLYAQQRELARFLAVVGAMHEHDGDFAGAMDAYMTAVALGVHVSQDRALLDWLVAVAVWSIGRGRVLSRTAQNEVPDDVLLGAQRRLAVLRALQPEKLAIVRAERVQAHATLDYVFRQEGAPSRKVQARLRKADAEFWEAFEEVAKLPVREYVQPQAPIGKARHERLRRALEQLEDCVRDIDLMAPLADHGAIMDHPVIHVREDLTWTVTDVFLALARYKAEHGAYPDKLEQAKDLMLLGGVDPFSGELLKYRREADGSFTLWSVGEDLKDDGGKATLVREHWGGPDYVWISRLEKDTE